MIYYFSGTGNSLAIAKKVGEKLSIPYKSIAQCIDIDSYINSDIIGFVFPVIAWGMPEIVERFLEQIQWPSKCYVFAIAVCGGNPAGVLHGMNKVLRKRGGQLSAGFTVTGREVQKIDSVPLIIRVIKFLNGKSPKQFLHREKEIINTLLSRDKAGIESSRFLAVMLGNFLHPIGLKKLSGKKNQLTLNDACINCGICMRVCPVKNLKSSKGHILRGEDCQHCFACYVVCRRHAIINNKTSTKYSMSNQIRLEEMLLR